MTPGAAGTPGRLMIVATPIGNLEDLSPRGLRTMADADLLVCEDTRRTRALLSSAGVPTPPLLSANEHTEAAQVETVLEHLGRGNVVAVVSDAGLPSISDPGERLVRAAAAAGFDVRVVPGPSAALSALVVSGLTTGRFVFEGFLPRSGSGRAERLVALASEQRTMVIYEAPHRLARTLTALADVLGGERRVALCRELTKLYEETWRGSLGGAVHRVAEHQPRGEYVIVVEGAAAPATAGDDVLRAALSRLRDEGISTRDAVAEVAGAYDATKRRVYELAVQAAPSSRPTGGPGSAAP
ncbi:MAG TPA: 16S rRNA (cytidine(1402)-2'-O)-methyltransferase [Acidimicrobiales bacterium]|nr:16S rRNA (cytidine(1402)-2'-O)-methyltransferase [Acidimicrobiales bacterium]